MEKVRVMCCGVEHEDNTERRGDEKKREIKGCYGEKLSQQFFRIANLQLASHKMSVKRADKV